MRRGRGRGDLGHDSLVAERARPAVKRRWAVAADAPNQPSDLLEVQPAPDAGHDYLTLVLGQVRRARSCGIGVQPARLRSARTSRRSRGRGGLMMPPATLGTARRAGQIAGDGVQPADDVRQRFRAARPASETLPERRPPPRRTTAGRTVSAPPRGRRAAGRAESGPITSVVPLGRVDFRKIVSPQRHKEHKGERN